MNLRCIVLIINILSFCLFLESDAQPSTIDTIKFSQYLKSNHLINEYVFLNKQLQQKFYYKTNILDSLRLELSSFYYQNKFIDSSHRSLISIREPFYNSNKLNHQYLDLLILNKEYNKAEQNIKEVYQYNFAKKTYQINSELAIKILNRSLSTTDTLAKNTLIDPTLNDIQNRYVHKAKSPIIAGLYSAFVPGLGKLYVGYKYQAFTSFITNALLISQVIESYSKVGVQSPRFIITSALFGAFYSGNIIGSYYAAKKNKIDHYKQLDEEIFEYYNSDLLKFNN